MIAFFQSLPPSRPFVPCGRRGVAVSALLPARSPKQPPAAGEKMGDFRRKTGRKNQKTGEFLSPQGENCQLRLTFSVEEVQE